MIEIEAFRRATGELLALERAGDLYGCSEGDRLVVQCRTTSLPRVSMSGRELRPERLIHDVDGFSAEYSLLIDTWAGRTVLVVQDGDAQRAVEFNVSPHANKLSSEEFDGLLTELSEISAALPWGLSAGAAGGGIASGAPVVVHPAIIQNQLPVLEALLRRLIADPPTVTLRRRALRPISSARRIDRHSLRWISARPPVLQALGLLDNGAVSDGSRTLVDQPVTLTSWDHPFTRYIAYLLRRVRERLVATSAQLRRSAGGRFPDPEADAFAIQLAGRVDAAVATLDEVLRAPLFRSVTPQPASAEVLLALPDHPLFAGLHRVGRRLLDPGLAYAPGSDLRSALKKTYDLFEILVLYRLAAGLADLLGPQWRLRRAKRLPSHNRELRPADGAVWHFDGPGGLGLQLRYQQSFRRCSLPPDTRKFSSLSGERIPDFLLVAISNGVPTSWLILDAKYRAGRHAIDDGLGDIHRYRDSLRVRGLQAAGAYIIVPRLKEHAAPYAQPSFLQSHRFGVLSLYEGGWLEPVRSWLSPMLEDARTRAPA